MFCKKINSVQVIVPYKRCINNCKFCISHINRISIDNQEIKFSKDIVKLFKNNLKYLYKYGCYNIVITGDNEPLMNMDFLMFFANILKIMDVNFKNIEIQTSGVLLNNKVLDLLKYKINVNLISISVASLDVNINSKIMGINEKLVFDNNKISSLIHEKKIKLRITIIMTDWFNKYQDNPKAMLDEIILTFNPEQITFKLLKTTNCFSDENNWINNHAASDLIVNNILDYLNMYTKIICTYSGIEIYEYKNISIMFDKDCMNNQMSGGYRYVLLLPNGELCNSWKQGEIDYDKR